MNCIKLMLATALLAATSLATAKDYTAKINTAFVMGSGNTERLLVTLDKSTAIASSGGAMCSGFDNVYLLDTSHNKPLMRDALLAAAASGAMVRISGDNQCYLWSIALYYEGISTVTIINPKY